MFARLLDAEPALFARTSASSLTNTLVYEVQTGHEQLANALLMVVRTRSRCLALLGYLLWLNWKLTLFVGLLAPAVAFVMRTVGGGCTGSRGPGRVPPTSWPTWWKRTCWPGASCGCTARQRRPGASTERRAAPLLLKSPRRAPSVRR
jgi:ABC-type multidrug transport system fused ATPase/permease subunit